MLSNLLCWLLSLSDQVDTWKNEESQTFEQWWAHYISTSANWNQHIDKAIIGGVLSQQIAFAFASGFQSGLHHLVPSLPENKIVSFGISEEQGGHPKLMKTSLHPIAQENQREGGAIQWELSGQKKWLTLSQESDIILVAATMGRNQENQNNIRVVFVNQNDEGVKLESMESIALVPEISHGRLYLDNVTINQNQFLPNDGYQCYVKPFRTVEDSFVNIAILGYLLRIAYLYSWPQETKTEIINLIINLRTIAIEDPLAPEIHIALEGFFTLQKSFFDKLTPLWNHVDESIYQSWKRDIKLLNIASFVRSKRLESAWEKFL
ncbi:MAG: acyl-CoA dehydrogenase [bacterium]|jgi:acyl-CoA dehydrogenase